MNGSLPAQLTLVERDLSRADLEQLRDALVDRLRRNPRLTSAQVTTRGSFASDTTTPGDIDVTINVDAPLRDAAVREAIEQAVVGVVSDYLVSGSALTVRRKNEIWQLHLDLAVQGTDGKMYLVALMPRAEGGRWVIARDKVVKFCDSYG